MRRSLHALLLPARPEQRRTRLLTTLTLVAGAATVAAVSATSTSETSTPSAAGTATLDGAAGGQDGTGEDQVGAGEDQDVAGTEVADDAASLITNGSPADGSAFLASARNRLSASEALDALTPLDGETTHGELDAIGPVERIAEVEPLPTLRLEAERAASLVYVAADGTEVTPERIYDFLAGRGAPLAEQAELFVEAGIRHDVDPRVVVAISIAESNGGKRFPQATHNVWGWGGPGGTHGLRGWDSWEDAIDEYTERLGELYDTDNVDWAFASRYCPPNTQWWLNTVTWAIGQI